MTHKNQSDGESNMDARAALDPASNAPRAGQLGATNAEQPASEGERARSEPGAVVDSQPLLTTEALLEKHHDVVYRYAYRLSGCSAAAEDITQEVFIRAYRSLHQLRDAQAARGWLLVIARNEFARWCKKFASVSAAPLEYLDEQSSEPRSESVDREEWVQRAMAELPSEFRLVLSMFYFEHLSYLEIAEQLEVPIGTVMSRLNRGRSHLKKALDALSEPREPAEPNHRTSR